MMRAATLVLLIALLPFVGGVCFAESGFDRDAPDPREIAIEGLLEAGGLCEEWSDPRPLMAPAGGGVLGWVYAQAFVWRADLGGKLWTNENAKLDLQDDLGLQNARVIIFPQVQFNFWITGFRFNGYNAIYDGAGVVSADFSFGGIDFQANEPVQSEFRIKNYKGTWLIMPLKTSVIALGLQLGVSYFDIDATITGQLSGTGRESANLPVPIIGVLAQAKLGRWLLELDVDGFSFDFAGNDVTLIEVQAMVGYTFAKVVAVHLGYKAQMLEGRTNGLNVDTFLDGIFLGASVRF